MTLQYLQRNSLLHKNRLIIPIKPLQNLNSLQLWRQFLGQIGVVEVEFALFHQLVCRLFLLVQEAIHWGALRASYAYVCALQGHLGDATH